MKVFRTLLALFLILIILGGVGYITWSFFMPGMNHSGTNTEQQKNPQGNTTPNNTVINTIAAQNKDKLTQAINTINEAMDLITIDPYSKTTISSIIPTDVQASTGQPSQGTGTINIYPEGNSSVNISPSGNNSNNNSTPSANTTQGAASNLQNGSFVYDQAKLQQLHSGIYTLAQGIMAVNTLNDDLLIQSSSAEANPPNYQTYVARYNTALQNKNRLNSSTSMLSQASTLINVNPYASSSGYKFNTDAMMQLHQGIFKLAQGVSVLNRLNDDFTRQMAEAFAQAQNLSYSANQTPNMTHGTVFGTYNLSTVFNIILIVLVVVLIIGILGAIFNMFKPKDNGNGTANNKPKVI